MNTAASLAILALLAGGQREAAAGTSPVVPAARRCVIISLDGLRPDAIDAAHAETLQGLIQAGAYNAECRNELPPATLPNHATMVTGQAVQQHGIILNSELPGHIRGPTIFDLGTKAHRRVAFFASKHKFGYLCRPKSADVRVIETDLDRLTDQVIQTLNASAPDLVFVHLSQPDGAGHAEGWMSPEYLKQVRRVDRLVGRIHRALVDINRMAGTLLIVTADHGGQGLNHMLDTPLERNVPLILYGPAVRPGGHIANPCTLRDVAPIAMSFLGVDAPADWAARSHPEAFLHTPLIAAPVPPPQATSPVWALLPFGLICAVGAACWIRERRRQSADSPQQCASS